VIKKCRLIFDPCHLKVSSDEFNRILEYQIPNSVAKFCRIRPPNLTIKNKLYKIKPEKLTNSTFSGQIEPFCAHLWTNYLFVWSKKTFIFGIFGLNKGGFRPNSTLASFLLSDSTINFKSSSLQPNSNSELFFVEFVQGYLKAWTHPKRRAFRSEISLFKLK